MKVDHLALYVLDIDSMRNFYVNYFNAKPSALYCNPHTGFRSYFLAFEDGARLELMTKPRLPNEEGREHTGYAHIAFYMGSRAGVNALTARLKEDGFPVVSGPRTTGDGYYESCVLDPEHNRVELVG